MRTIISRNLSTATGKTETNNVFSLKSAGIFDTPAPQKNQGGGFLSQFQKQPQQVSQQPQEQTIPSTGSFFKDFAQGFGVVQDLYSRKYPRLPQDEGPMRDFARWSDQQADKLINPYKRTDLRAQDVPENLVEPEEYQQIQQNPNARIQFLDQNKKPIYNLENSPKVQEIMKRNEIPRTTGRNLAQMMINSIQRTNKDFSRDKQQRLFEAVSTMDGDKATTMARNIDNLASGKETIDRLSELDRQEIERFQNEYGVTLSPKPQVATT
jgi:hypothetical protein